MNQYSILKDVLTDKAYGLAVKSIDGFEFMGFNEQSCKWANLANQKQLDISQLPDGIIAEDLQDITEDIAAQLNLKIKAPLAVVKHKEKLNNFNFKESERFDTGSTTPSITDMPLGEFEKEVRDMVLEFKAKSFKKNIVQSEIALKSRFNQLAFNLSTNRFQPRPNSNFKQIQADELRTKASNGMQRRFGKEITEQINSTIETKWPGEFITGFLLGRRRRKKRKKMSFKTMEILDFHEKGIGRAIGRAATPNVGRSRRIGMRASRKITGQLDPSKRRDVDGDGMIFDGTWREMPDPTRFKPNERVRKPFSPDPNKPIGSQSLQILEENEKRRGDFARMLREVERGIPQTTRKPRSERSTRGVSSRVYRSGQDSGAETPRKNLQPLPTNVKGFIQRLKEKYAKPIDSNDPELTESLRKIIKEREARDGIARESSLQALFREWENGFISDRNRKAALDFLDGIEKDYQKQDNQSPSVTTRPVSQEDRIAAAHLAKLIAMSDDDYKESNFNAIRDIDYSPIPEALKRRTEQDRQFNQDFDRRNPNLARQSRASGLRSRVYRPGQDTGAETYIDDIPDMSDDDLRKEIERLENARYPYDGNVTKPRMDKERIEEMRRELQRRSRGGGRKPIKKPSRALDNPSTEGLEAARLFLENIKKNRRNLTESEREALVNERTPLRGLSSQSDGGRQEIERLVVSEGYPSKAKRKKMFVSKEDVDSFIEDLKLEYRKRRRQIESEIDNDGYYMDDEELIQRFMNDYNMSRGEARQAMRDYRRNWDLLEKEDERHQNRLTELEEERAKLPYQQEIDDPIKLGPNGFPEREDQMERYEELMKEEAEPVFRVRKKPEAGGKRENVGERSARGVSSRTASRDSVSDEEGRIGSVRQATQRASETIQGRRQQRGLSDEEGRIGSVRQAAQRASENRQNRGLRSISPDDDPADTLDFDDVSITPDNYRRDRMRSDRERARTSLRVAREEQRNLGKYSKRGKEEIDRAKRNYTNDFINRAKNEIAKSFASNEEGGDDLDSGLRRIAKVLGLDEVGTSKLSALLYDVAQSPKSKKEIDFEINQILTNPNDRKIVKAAFGKFAELNDSEDKLISQVKKEITQSYDSNQEGGDDLDSGLRRIAERQGLKKSTTNKLSALLYEIAESPKSKKEIDSKINQIVEDPTDREIIKAAFNKFAELNNKPEESSLSTSGARSSGRGTRPLPVAMTPNARRAMANTQRASSPRGLQSRSGVQKQSKGIPGVDKIGPSDGAQWEALTPDQKTTAAAALDKELERVTGELKKRFAGYWRGQVRGAKKQGIRGGRYAPRANDEALTTSDITEIQRQLDSNTSAKPEVRAAVQKQIDAVRLLTTMKSKKDYSMLEQLHPAQKAKVLDALKKTDDFKPLKGFTRTSESTAFKGGAGLSKEDLLTSLTPDISLDDKKKDKKNISFRNRILRANPERQRRRELRRQRRTGAIGRTGISLDPELQLKKRKLRAAAFKRQILSKFRKTKDAEQLADSLGDRKAELHPVQIDANGNIKLAPNFVETMDSLDKRLLEGKKDGDKVYDVLLRDLWENFGYSEVPALITEEEVKSLLAAGWQPIVRGTGNEEVMSESYVEQFLTSEGRFIAGQGGRAYGVGEYFAYPGGNWSGYSGTADSRHTMLALIPPTATIMTRQELSNEQREMNRLTTAINNEFRIAGDRETVSVLSAQELAQMIRKASPQLANSKTRSGQILNQLTLRLEELDNMPGDTSQERKRILNTFDLLERMSKKESGHFAPMIGVDAIDTNDGDGSKDPVLLHNRSIVAAFQTPMTRKQAEEMSAGVKKVWTKFKSRNKVVSAEQSPDSDSTATRRVKPRLIRRARSNTPQQQTQQSAQPQSQAKKSSGVVDTSSWKTGTPQNVGSNPAKLLTAPDGTEYYAKLPKPNENVQQATERMETEVLASELYKLAGVPTVDLMMGDENGTPQMLSKMIQSRGPNSQSDQDSARAGFVVDAWLANWDAPLNDNIKFDSQNRPVRIDVGGSLDYRAQGAKKDTTRTPFGDTVGEILSMQKRGTFNFANMDPAEIKKQAQAMSSVTDASIRATVSKIVGDPQRAAKLAQTLINRRNDIVTRYG